MLRIMLTVMLLSVCLQATAQNTAESESDRAASPYTSMSDDELVQAFLTPGAGRVSSGSKPHPKTGNPTDMAALEELFQRHRDWHWQQMHAYEAVPGMTAHEVMIAWGKPRKINEREEGDVWVYRTKFPPSGFYLEFDPDGTLARIRD